MQNARMNFEAGNYDQTLMIYQDLLNENLQDWERAIIFYNIGTTLLSEGKWNEALFNYHQASELIVESPSLRQRLTSNTALANLLIAQEKIHAINSLNATETSLSSAIKSLNQVSYDLEMAKQASCELAFAEGEKICPDSWELSQMKLKANVLASTLQNEVLRFALNNKSLFESIQGALIFYQLALLQRNLKKTSITALIYLQSILFDSEKSNESQRNLLLEAQKYLTEARKILDDKHPFQARLFVETARHNIEQIYRSAYAPQTAKTVLENVLYEQEFASSLNQLRHMAQKKEKVTDEVNTLLLQSQKRTNELATPFPKAITAQQAEDFSAKSSTNQSQKMPWDQIISLFLQGQEAAIEAAQLLTENHFQPSRALSMQIKAIDNWKQALKLLTELQSAETKKQESTGQSKDAEKLPQPQPQMESSEKKINAVFGQLQDMEEDDRSKSRLETVPSENREERPW